MFRLLTMVVDTAGNSDNLHGIWTFRSSALSFPGAKSLQIELSFPWNGAKSPRTFAPCHPWNFRTRGTFAPQERMSQELSFHGTFIVNLHVSTTLTTVLPVKNFICSRLITREA